MSGNKKPKKLWRRVVGFTFSVITLIVLGYISFSLITSRPIDFSWFTNIFLPRQPIEVADELLFDVGRDRVFADMDGHVVAAGMLGVQVLDYRGNETLRVGFRMDRPAVSVNNRRAIAFDIGGHSVLVFEAGRVIYSMETNGTIISASINRNGWFTVSTQEGAGLRSLATVYNDRGNAVFRANLHMGYALYSVLSPDNRDLAVINLTDVGSRIPVWQGINQQDPGFTFELYNELILDMRFLPNGQIMAVSTDRLISIDRNGVSNDFFEFGSSRLGGLISEDGAILLHLLDYGVGHTGRLIRLDERGNIRAERITTRDIISMSYGGGFFVIMSADGISFLDENLYELPHTAESMILGGVNRVLALRDGVALVTGEHIAAPIKVITE